MIKNDEPWGKICPKLVEQKAYEGDTFVKGLNNLRDGQNMNGASNMIERQTVLELKELKAFIDQMWRGPAESEKVGLNPRYLELDRKYQTVDKTKILFDYIDQLEADIISLKTTVAVWPGENR